MEKSDTKDVSSRNVFNIKITDTRNGQVMFDGNYSAIEMPRTRDHGDVNKWVHQIGGHFLTITAMHEQEPEFHEKGKPV